MGGMKKKGEVFVKQKNGEKNLGTLTDVTFVVYYPSVTGLSICGPHKQFIQKK